MLETSEEEVVREAKLPPSERDFEVYRVTVLDGDTKITREEQGNPRYLQQALRVTVAQGRFAAALVKDAEAARRAEEEAERRRDRGSWGEGGERVF